jgi:hypothetical protein
MCLLTGSGGMEKNEAAGLKWFLVCSYDSKANDPSVSHASTPALDKGVTLNTADSISTLDSEFSNLKISDDVSSPSPEKAKESDASSQQQPDKQTEGPRTVIDGKENNSPLTQEHLGIIFQIIGNCYRHGRGCTPDSQAAFRYLSRSANLGNIDAYATLATMYEKGEDIAVDPIMAFNMNRKAAEGGHMRCMFRLGLSYELGIGTLNIIFYKTNVTKQPPKF